MHLHFLGVDRGVSDDNGSDGGSGGSDGVDGGSGDSDSGSDGGGGEVARLISKDSNQVSPSVPRKTSGAAKTTSAVD